MRVFGENESSVLILRTHSLTHLQVDNLLVPTNRRCGLATLQPTAEEHPARFQVYASVQTH